MNNLVITGAAGFIGSTLARYLSLTQTNNLVLIDSLEFGNIDNLPTTLRDKLIVTNCLDTELLMDILPENAVVFHLAGISSLAECESNYIKSIENNFLSTVNVYEAGIVKGMKKFIFASTSAVYENNLDYPFKELDQINPDLMYSYSKYLCENYLKFRTNKKDSCEVVIARFFNVFGYNQNIFRKTPPLTGYLINCLQNNQVATIFNNNNDIKRDYIFIDDLVFILTVLVNKSQYNQENFMILNLTSGNLYSVQDIIFAIEKVANKKLNYLFERPTNIWLKYPEILEKISEERISEEVFKKSIGDNSKLRRILPENFKFKSMEEGVFIMLNSVDNL
jgi:UDP-glucose 4-epimerase